MKKKDTEKKLELDKETLRLLTSGNQQNFEEIGISIGCTIRTF